jgi:tetratricopeptide (TPR) repeat protein
VYDETGEYSKALSDYEEALKIQQQSLAPNHPDLVSSYGNIGLVYYNMHEYSKARSFYECAVDIEQHSLPPNHPDMQTYRKNPDKIIKKLYS